MKLSEIKITPIIESIQMLDIPDEEYFSEKYAGYISNSRLKNIDPDEEGTPEKFFTEVPRLYSDSLYFGSAVHELTLQPESFYLVDSVDRPTAKAGYMADELYKPSGVTPTDEEIIEASNKIGYYKDKMNDKRITELRNKCNNYWRNRALYEAKNTDEEKTPVYLDPKSREKLNGCLKALNKNKEIQKLLHPEGVTEEPIVGNETAILMDVLVEAPGNEPFILHLKSKLDNYSIDKENNTITVNDLKTTGKYITDFDNAVKKYHYYREMGMYTWLLALYCKHKLDMEKPIIKSNFLAVETFPDYYTKVSPMTAQLFKEGFEEFKKLLKLVAFYCCDGNGYESFRTSRVLQTDIPTED